ncbi:MAG: acyltransferase family protein [Prevotella sp.]|nr:acyltransferase family protein [Prevotella sp.]
MSEGLHRYESKIEFSKIGRDLSLDFVKGICILLVLIHHTTTLQFHQDSFFYIWGYPAVPLFLLIQVFHSYKRGFEKQRWNVLRIWKRAVWPFVLVELVIFVYMMLAHPMASWRSILTYLVYWGGGGPGSYYPWVYIQFAFLLPLMAPLFRRLKSFWLAALFLLLSIGGEVLCNMVHLPEWQYRLLFIRYIFLIYLGYQMVVRGVALNILTVSLSLVSLLALYFFEVKDFRLYPIFYYAENWKSFHWICYFYIAYLMVYFLCKFFYWLPANNKIENVICVLGEHSYAIYIFQLFYFVVIAPFIREQLEVIGNPVVIAVLYLLLAILLCSIPVVYFVRGLSSSAVFWKLLMVSAVLTGVVLLVTWLWRPFYKAVEPFALYKVDKHYDDTLRVIMIGDSWVYFHETLRRDSTFEEHLKRVMGNRKVKVTAKGKGGATSGQVFEQMSAERMLATEYDLSHCSQPIIEKGADYCVISAGINDARQRRGKVYYVTNYFHIIRTLLASGIRPVVMEIPDVDVDEYYEGNTLYYQLRAWIAMRVLKTGLYGTSDYRLALKDSLEAHHLMDSIIYIPAASWNPEGWRDKRDIYTDDHFHLNLVGYDLLDSTFTAEIIRDYRARRTKR